MKKRVSSYENGVKVECVKKYIRKRVYVIIIKY